MPRGRSVAAQNDHARQLGVRTPCDGRARMGYAQAQRPAAAAAAAGIHRLTGNSSISFFVFFKPPFDNRPTELHVGAVPSP